MARLRMPAPIVRFRAASWRTLPWVRNPLIFVAPLFLVFLCQLITQQEGLAALDWMNTHAQPVFWTYTVLLLLELLLLSVGGRLFPAVLVIALPPVLLSLASYLKQAVNGIPLLASDLAMVGQAGEIAGFLRPGMDLGAGTRLAIWLLLLLLAAAFCFSRGNGKLGWQPRVLSGALCASLAVNLMLIPPCTALLAGLEGETQAQRNERLGLLAGIYSAVSESAMQEPDTYNENNMHRILAELERDDPHTPVPQVRPNVVLILSESFFDVTTLPNVTFDRDPIPTYHALAKRFPAGTFLANTYAGGTGNVEMEVLTGVPLAFPGAGEDLTSLADETAYDRIPSIVKSFAAQGYRTSMAHSYTDRLYNRTHNMPAIGFQEVLFQDDFTVDKTYAGGYVSDDTLADQLIATFEAKGDAPIFLYGLSMENHQPYYADKFDQPSGVGIQTDRLGEADKGVLDGLVQGLADADASLKKLTDYFSRSDEPTILVFYGDHLPSLSLTEGEGTVYTALGLSRSADTSTWDAETMKQMHTTNYLVWNNYGADLEAPEELGVVQVGSLILDWAGLPKPLYFQWVDRAAQEMKCYRERLFVAGDGTPYTEPPEDSAETVGLYRSIVYDILYGSGYIAHDLTRPGGSES